MKRSIILFFIISFIQFANAVDTIRVMQYNLLYYDKNTGWCNSTNNNVDLKDGYLRDITGYYKPDIFTVNEMNGSPTSVERLLENVFNINGESKYKSANYTGSYLVNMLYYNTHKLALKSQQYIVTSPRITDVYKLYYKSENLSRGDTIFLTCIVTHLKAGNTTSDREERAVAAQQIMSFVENQNIRGNVLFMGDLNVYNSTETAFQTFITSTPSGVRFYDPVNAIGSWQNNPAYTPYHTQSTHTSDGSTCHSGGGMDDRFDFILATSSILDGSLGLHYLEDSYWAYGQDGNRFNQSLINPPNYTLPNFIINSLFDMSDHLPVVLKLYAEAEYSSSIYAQAFDGYRVNNPVNETLFIWKKGHVPDKTKIQIMNILGGVIFEENITLYPNKRHSIPVSGFNPGIYLLVINGQNNKEVKRIVKQ